MEENYFITRFVYDNWHCKTTYQITNCLDKIAFNIWYIPSDQKRSMSILYWNKVRREMMNIL